MDVENGNIYMAIAVRNGGTGLAVIHGWRAEVAERTISRPPSSDEFRSQQRDVYIPAGDLGFWQGAIRDRSDPSYQELRAASGSGARVLVDLMYGHYEGGQRAIARFAPSMDDGGAGRGGRLPERRQRRSARATRSLRPRARPED
jgi:hypothetical protein